MEITSLFLDTAAILPIVTPSDPDHQRLYAAFTGFLKRRAAIVTTSYVVHEAIALLQARHGISHVRRFAAGVLPACDIVWIDRALHEAALAKLLAAGARQVSLTDWSSFEVMRARGITRAFTLDAHFRDQGFTLVPA